MKTILVLGARKMQLPALRVAKEMGLFVIAIDPLPDAVGATVADLFYSCDLADIETIIAIAKQHSIDGIVTLAADYPVPTVAKVARQLNLPGLGERAALLATNKAQMRQALAQRGVKVPQWQETSDRSQAIQALRDLGKTAICKPVDSSGGRGVTLLEANATDKEIEKGFQKALSFSLQKKAIIEEFIAGKEVSVEAITIDGKTEIIQITDKLTTEAPFFVEIGHSQPTQLSKDEINKVKQLTLAAITALEIDNSPSHTEIKFAGEQPYIIEVGARLGGGYITSDLVPLSCGVNLVKALIQLAIGDNPDLNPTQNHGAAIRFLQPDPGRVTNITGLSLARQMKGVTEIAVEVAVGETIEPFQNATSRVGHVICTGETAKIARENAEAAKNVVKIDVAT